jgi:2,4-dienoyl-CoA reductase-like NADH-dependent reductase (Old Yellow Enzyme family)
MTSMPMLLTPIRLGAVNVRNRIVITAHGASEQFRNPRLPAEPYIEYLRRRAAGGVGMIIAQALYVNPLAEYPDEFTVRHTRLAEAVHAEGATLLLQLVHLGATFRSEADVHRPPLWTFSTVVTDQGEVSHAMTDEQIEMTIAGYGRIARMASDAGFDGVEIHGAHGYLGQQSISPWLNRREDKWGQDRTLFLRRIIDTVRAEIGPDRILGYRTATDDLRSPEDGGLGAAGQAAVVRNILATGEIDVLNTTVGSGGKSYARAIPSYRHREAVNIPKAEALNKALGHQVPLIGVGRIASIGLAETLVQSGACDMVAMTRAHIADPDLVSKFARGDAHRIRPCVGALVCNSRKLAGFSEISCIHNPEVLREHELTLDPAATPKDVVVVGAGPAGLKYAEIAARRGHRVRVFDAGSRTGGRLRAVERTAASDLASTVDHLASELAHLAVPVQLGTRVDEALLRSLNPEHVVIATGAEVKPADVFDGETDVQTISSVEALERPEDLVGEVIVYDTLGAAEGALVAEALANAGKQVHLVTPFEMVMPYAGASMRMETPDILRAKLAGIHTEAVIGGAQGSTVWIVRPDGSAVTDLTVGAVVTVLAPVPSLALVEVAKKLGIPHTVLGDAVAPRVATDAFRDGEEAALLL